MILDYKRLGKDNLDRFGDRKLTELVRVSGRMFALCYWVARHREDAEDAVQEAGVASLVNAETLLELEPIARERRVAGIARNKAVDQIRMRTARGRTTMLDDIDDVEDRRERRRPLDVEEFWRLLLEANADHPQSEFMSRSIFLYRRHYGKPPGIGATGVMFWPELGHSQQHDNARDAWLVLLRKTVRHYTSRGIELPSALE